MSKERGIFKRGGIYWIRYADVTGRIVRESARTRNINEARKLLAQRKAEVAQGKQPEKLVIKNHSFRELAEKYKEYASIQKSFSDTKRFYIQELVEYFKDMPLLRFNPQVVEQFVIEQLKKGLAPATVNRKLACLKHMFTKAVEWEMATEEVLRKVRKVKFLKENNKRLRYLTKEEIQKLLNACDRHLYPIVFTALNTGMRKEEILSLKWSQVDIKNGYIHVEKTKNSERRDIPMNDALKQLFRKLFTERNLGVEYVFVNPLTNTRYDDVKRSFQSACKKAGISDFHFHDLRHTFASHLVMSGVDLATVKELLGHKDIKMTLRYSHLAPEHKSKAVRLFDTLFSNCATKTDTVQLTQ